MQTGILLHGSLAPGVAPPWAERLLQTLPYARRVQIEHADTAARIASLAGLALALTGAARIAGAAPRVAGFRFERDSKPRLELGPSFSVSHTGNHVACVVCAGVDVGLDIETVPSGAGRVPLRTLRRWTATEATLKAAGSGLRQVRDVRLDESARAATLEGRRYQIRELRLTSRVRGHVASAEPVELSIESVALAGPEVSAAVQCALGLPTQG